jgi:hypothetical protein
MKSQSYMTRALRAKDTRFATILGNLGYGRTGVLPAEKTDPAALLAELRTSYQEKFGKRPFHGWDSPTLAAKIAEAKD